MLKAIETVAREEGASFVLDKVSEATIVLYADAKFDLTYKVIDRLKRGSAPRTTRAGCWGRSTGCAEGWDWRPTPWMLR